MISSVILGMIIAGSMGIAAEIRDISSIEVEDRDLIRHMVEDGFTEYAEEEALIYLRKYPEGIFRDEVIYIRAQIAVKDQRFANAISHLSHLIQRYPGSIYIEESLYYSGLLYIQTEKPALGEKNLTRLLNEFPDTQFGSNSRYQLGKLAFSQKNWTMAETYFQTLLKDNTLSEDQSLETRTLLAWSLYFQGNTDSAETSFKDLMTSDLTDEGKSKIAYQLAIDAYKNQDYSKALNWFQTIEKNWPASSLHHKAVFWKAETLFLMIQKEQPPIDLRKKQEAIQLYTINLGLPKPIEPENSHYHRGWLYLDMGQVEKAEEDFQWLQINRPAYAKDLDLTFIRARQFETQKKWKTANQIYLRSLRLQTDNTARQKLLIGITRNDFRQKDCDGLINHIKLLDLQQVTTERDELLYYLGTCHFNQSEWDLAGQYFSEIPSTSRYTAALFEDYLTVFQKTDRLADGITFLNQVEFVSDVAPRQRILLYKTDFQLTLKQWLPAIRTINQILAITPEKSDDPLFILNLAKIYDQILSSLDDPRWLAANPSHETADYYARQALENYELAYKLLPDDEKKTKLAILDLLIDRYQRRNQRKKLISAYNRAIELTDIAIDKDSLVYDLANIYIKTPATRDNAIELLTRLHRGGNTDKYIHASSLLAELYIGKKEVPQAIKILTEVSPELKDSSDWFFDIHFRLGELYQFTEQWKNAINQYDMVAQADKNHVKKAEAMERSKKIKIFLNE